MMKPAMSFVVLCGISLLFIQQAPAEAPELMAPKSIKKRKDVATGRALRRGVCLTGCLGPRTTMGASTCRIAAKRLRRPRRPRRDAGASGHNVRERGTGKRWAKRYGVFPLCCKGAKS